MGNNQANETPLPKKMDRNVEYRLQIAEFKKIADMCLTKMMSFNIENEASRNSSLKIADSLKRMLDTISNRYLKTARENQNHQIDPQYVFAQKVEDIEVKIQQLAHFDIKQTLYSQASTSMAFKDNNCFMICTRDFRMRIIEKGSEVFVGDFERVVYGLSDIIYCKVLDCYLFSLGGKIYRKDINKEPYFMFMDEGCGTSIGASFRYSELHERLIIPKDSTKIAAINLETKEVELEILKEDGDEIMDFQLHGLGEDKVASLTQDGHLFVSELNYFFKKGEIYSLVAIELIKERHEHAETVVVCPKNRYIFVEIYRSQEPHICSRMMIFWYKKRKLKLCARIDQFGGDLAGCKSAMTCLGYFNNNVVFLGLSLVKDGITQLYCYNIHNNKFEELKGARVEHQELDPTKIHRVGSDYYYTGLLGKVMRLRVKFKTD